MVRLSSLKVDQKKSTDGVWKDYEGGGRYLLARIPNEKFSEHLRKARMPHLREIRRNPDGEKAREAMTDTIVHTVLLDWDEVEADDGTPIPYSPEIGMDVLTDPAFEELYLWILREAGDMEAYRVEQLEDSAKNS